MAIPAKSADEQVNEITQSLQRDIIEFLSSKYTENATISLHEVMRLYDCPPDRAKRVLANLVRDGVVAKKGEDVYAVTI